MDAAIDHQNQEGARARPQLSASLWKPWYAKLWCATILVWWVGMAVSPRVDVLESFYCGWVAGYLNVLFCPMTSLIALGIGHVRGQLDSFVGEDHSVPLSDEEDEDFVDQANWDRHNRFMEDVGKGTDMFDPQSGPLWIGNPLNPQNAAYIDTHTSKHR